MSWNTKDYILYDDTNGVYISVESSFVGVDTSAARRHPESTKLGTIRQRRFLVSTATPIRNWSMSVR